jgi:hypothetical protein
VSNHIEITKGNIWGHLFRRLIHICFQFIFTWLFYRFGSTVSAALGFGSTRVFLIVLFLLILIGEGIRIKLGFVFFGQREFEKRSISSAGWTLLGLVGLFYFAPDQSYVYPVVCLSALLDPLMGELKPYLRKWQVCLLALGLGLVIWWFVAHNYYAWPFWYGFIICSVAILMDYLPWRFLDDNFTMLVVPFACLLLLHHVFN